MPEQTVQTAAAADLAARMRGELIQPGDEAYDDARRVWNGMIDRRPGLIARCACTEDVVAAVALARQSGLTVAVRGGGHSAAGYGTCDDGIVIDLSAMQGVEVDAGSRTARAEAGATWGVFDAATQEHGLAVTGGRFSTTGIAGLTLGSGSGWLERKCGLTADNLLEVEIVTADGGVLVANADENAELFWGIRGGSGNFGVVTRFTYRLHEVGPLVYGGLLACAPERAPQILRFLDEYMEEAPDDLGTAAAFLSAPPEPFVPPEVQGAPMLGLVICWSGDHAEGERMVAPIREVAQPMMDMVQPMPYTALQSMLDGGGPKGVRAYMKAEFFKGDLDDELIAKLCDHGARRPGPMAQLLLEPMGGAIARTGEDETALGRRDVRWCYHALGLWMDPADDDAHVAWTRDLAADLEPHTQPGVYLNYTSDAGEERVRSSYGPDKYARLQALKDRYDPDNVFRLNQNVRPSGG